MVNITKLLALDLAPLKRFAAPVEISKAVAYLASNHAVNIRGIPLYVDGGTATG